MNLSCERGKEGGGGSGHVDSWVNCLCMDACNWHWVKNAGWTCRRETILFSLFLSVSLSACVCSRWILSPSLGATCFFFHRSKKTFYANNNEKKEKIEKSYEMKTRSCENNFFASLCNVNQKNEPTKIETLGAREVDKITKNSID